MQRSTHVCYVQSDRLLCARCLSSVPIRNYNKCVHFLGFGCASIGSDTDRPVPLSSDLVQIGKLDIHVSHKPLFFKGIIYCDKCGAMSQRKKLGNLASVCCPPTIYGNNNLDRLRKGNLPINVSAWPHSTLLVIPLILCTPPCYRWLVMKPNKLLRRLLNNQFLDIHRDVHSNTYDISPSMSVCDLSGSEVDMSHHSSLGNSDSD